MPSIHSCIAFFSSLLALLSDINFTKFSLIYSLILRIPLAIPNPYSALSSNKLLPQAIPLPLRLEVVYGIDGALPPYIDEQPVALAITIRSPKS
ncbi:MAG: hypothetical protein BWX61_00810 [Bacteroidetes bacterium ADurb.Bin035]|nr:MAG: hypothetical protein BWX61_00810 [Bacteroidetes bacterium ADurb.Bin035]